MHCSLSVLHFKMSKLLNKQACSASLAPNNAQPGEQQPRSESKAGPARDGGSFAEAFESENRRKSAALLLCHA
jgi:hypothetical protein